MTKLEELEAALTRIEELMEIEGRLEVETDELEVLAALVEMYEDAEFPMSVPSPIAADAAWDSLQDTEAARDANAAWRAYEAELKKQENTND